MGVIFGIMMIVFGICSAFTGGLAANDDDHLSGILVAVSALLIFVGVCLICVDFAEYQKETLTCPECGEQYTDYEYCPIDGVKLEGVQ